MARAVLEHVLLPADWDRLVRLREMLVPGERVAGRARPQRRLFFFRRGVLQASRQQVRNGMPTRRARHGHRRLAPASELEHVVRATGFGARADRRRLPAAEGLAAHDGAGDVTIDVEASRLDAREPAIDLAIVERL